jgi:predicted phosphoribosyltransferase
MIFKDRVDAGEKLAVKLQKFKNQPNTIILGLPRGGVVMAGVVAKKLHLPLDIVVPRKISAPENHEFAIGAITLDGQMMMDEKIISSYDIGQEYIDQEIVKEKKEAVRRLNIYRGDRPTLDLKNKIAIIIDDGIATGATMRVAIKFVKANHARKIIVAVPVCASDTLEIIKKEVDEIICLYTPYFFGAVGEFYKEFEQTEDEEVVKIMKRFD